MVLFHSPTLCFHYPVPGRGHPPLASPAPTIAGSGFISYSNNDREVGAQAKAVLGAVGIDGFLAHDDLEVSEEWKEKILEELRRCDLFVPLLSRNFVESEWAPQEAGYIVSRPEVVIAPLSIDGTTPFGFLGSVQGGRIGENGVTQELLVEPVLARLVRHVPRKILPGVIRRAGEAHCFRDAERQFRPLVPLFEQFSAEEANALAEASVKNGQIWAAQLCRDEYLPDFIQVHADNIEPDTLRALRYQIQSQSWYDASAEELLGDME